MRRPVLLTLIQLLAALALGVSVYLTWLGFAGGEAMGCDGASTADCDEVLSSGWARFHGVPVALPAVVLYAAIFVVGWRIASPRDRGTPGMALSRSLLVGLAALAAGAALWFIALQSIAVGAFCPFCMAVHACGLAIFPLSLVAALREPNVDSEGERAGLPRDNIALVAPPVGLAIAALLGFILLHWNGRGKSYVVQDLGSAVTDTGADQPTESSTSGVTDSHGDENSGTGTSINTPPGDAEPAEKRQADPLESFTILNGKKTLDLDEWMLLGSREAHQCVVEMFDYTCHHCRALHWRLEEARETYAGQFSIVLVPVPLNAGCNRSAETTKGPHFHACEYAKLAIAVWRHKPEDFEEFHTWLIEGKDPPPLGQARFEAARILGDDAETLADSAAVRDQLARSVELFELAGKGAIPKLVFADKAVYGRMDSTSDVLELLQAELHLTEAEAGDE